MIERLDQLTLAQFIDLACGNPWVLNPDKQAVEQEKLVSVCNRLLMEFRSIAMPEKAKMEMYSQEDKHKLLMKEKCTRVLILLCMQGHHEDAKEVLADLDVDTAPLDTPQKVEKKCRAMLNDALYEIERLEEESDEDVNEKNSDEVRKAWYKEIAWVMSVFKMSIDVNTVNAAIYANLVQQAVQRMKQLSKMPSLMGRML